MDVYRITKAEHSKSGQELLGLGGHYTGGRWHRMGTEVIYAGDHRSLSMLERLVHDSTDTMNDDLVILTIHIPDDVYCETHTSKKLPENWNSIPEGLESVEFGQSLLESNRAAVFLLPSAICPDEYNIIINPNHPDAKRITLKDKSPFSYDLRLIK